MAKPYYVVRISVVERKPQNDGTWQETTLVHDHVLATTNLRKATDGLCDASKVAKVFLKRSA